MATRAGQGPWRSDTEGPTAAHPPPAVQNPAVTRRGILADVRTFNTAGPMVPGEHYCIPPLERLDLAHLLGLIGEKRYFVLHAPRQTGKTSSLLALRDLLNGGSVGDFRCIYVNFEPGQAARDDAARAMPAILHELDLEAQETLGDDSLGALWPATLERIGPDAALREVLRQWARADSRPLVLLIDEIDALMGDVLLTVLRQLRAGYTRRPAGFPQSVVLCGVRDVRDYRILSRAAGEIVSAGSAFNIKAESLRLGDFSETEMRALLGQHTADTEQVFREDALEAVWVATQGQPWLVNALARQMCSGNESGRDPSRPLGGADVSAAREELILRRDTHLDQLADKLAEPRIRRVIEPMLTGDAAGNGATARDIEYVRDLGLIARDAPVRIANPIYAEVIPRELSWHLQEELVQEAAWYITPDGGLDLGKLLGAFQQFFREHSEHWAGRFDYAEAGPQLILQGFLQRIVNGGGRLEREYGLGRGRTDLAIVWPCGAQTERFVVECKVLHGGLEATLRDGARQTAAYMDRLGAEAGHLVLFDRRAGRSWEEKVFRREEAAGDRTITVWGM